MAVKTTGDFGVKAIDPDRIMRNVEGAMEAGLHEGAEMMRQFIETRGTMREWSRPWGASQRSASIPGRDDTGQMKNAVQGEIEDFSRDTIRGVLGWAPGSPLYYQLQEHGFFHVLTGEDVAAMYALRDAGEWTKEELDRRIRDALKGLT